MSDKSCLTHRLQTENSTSNEKIHKEEVKNNNKIYLIYLFYFLAKYNLKK